MSPVESYFRDELAAVVASIPERGKKYGDRIFLDGIVLGDTSVAVFPDGYPPAHAFHPDSPSDLMYLHTSWWEQDEDEGEMDGDVAAEYERLSAAYGAHVFVVSETYAADCMEGRTEGRNPRRGLRGLGCLLDDLCRGIYGHERLVRHGAE